MIRDANLDDVESIAGLAHARRLKYESAQSRFWKPAADASERHTSFLMSQIQDEDVVSLVSTDDSGGLLGYLFATLIPAPPVYEPGGLTGSIDDFAVARPALWQNDRSRTDA